MSRWILIFLAAGLTAQPSISKKILPSGHAVKTAEMLERKGDVDGAIAIYEDLAQRQPKNNQVYHRLKKLYKENQRYPQLISLLHEHSKLFPNDIQSHVELGEAYYFQDDKPTAFKIWHEFEENYKTNSTAYTVLLHMFIRFSLEDEMKSLVQRGRLQFRHPSFLSMELANYYSARKNYQNAVEEYLTYAYDNPGKLNIVLNRILSLSDSEDSHPVIISVLMQYAQEDPAVTSSILSALYFKIGEYEKAYQEHTVQGLSHLKDVTRWLSFAKNLRLENQYALSLNAYRFILSSPPNLLPVKLKGQALLGLGQTFEDQILPQSSEKSLVQFFPNNFFFKQDIIRTTAQSSPLLQSTFHMYDSVLVTMPFSKFSHIAYFRMGEIKFRITQDYDGAEQSYRSALKNNRDLALTKQIHLRLADLYMAKGDFHSAIDYLNSISHPYPGKQAKVIQTYFLMGEPDTTQTLITESLSNVTTDHPLFNDLMEVQGLLQQHYFDGSLQDKSAFQRFILAENQLVQNKLTEALETFKSIRTEFEGTTIVPLSTLREALIRLLFHQSTHTLDLAEQLTKTELADVGYTLQGTVIEQAMNNHKLALDFYQVVLEDYPLSLLAEPVRHHIRILMKD